MTTKPTRPQKIKLSQMSETIQTNFHDAIWGPRDKHSMGCVTTALYPWNEREGGGRTQSEEKVRGGGPTDGFHLHAAKSL